MCRFTEWGRRTTFLGAKENILAAVTPLHGGQRPLTALQGLLDVFPKIVESLTNLGISLRNPGAVVHPGVMYGRCCVDYWDGKPVAKKPLFVKVDEYTDEVLVGLLNEFQALKEAITAKVQVDFNELARCTCGTWFVTPVNFHTNA